MDANNYILPQQHTSIANKRGKMLLLSSAAISGCFLIFFLFTDILLLLLGFLISLYIFVFAVVLVFVGKVLPITAWSPDDHKVKIY